MPNPLKAQAIALADYLEAADLTTEECPQAGLGRASDLLEMLAVRASRKGAVGTLIDAAKQRVLWLRSPTPTRIYEQNDQASAFNERYPLAEVYSPKVTPRLLRALAEL